MRRNGWTEEQKAKADAMRDTYTSEEIGFAIGRSAKAVRQYFYRDSGMKDAIVLADPPEHVDYMPWSNEAAFARAMAGQSYGPGTKIDPYSAPIPAAMLVPQSRTYAGVTSEW